MIISEKIKDVDYLSKNIQLYYDGNTRYKSILGGFISILLTLIGGICLIYMFTKVTNREETVVYENRIFRNSSSYILNTSENIIAFIIVDKSGREIDETAFSVYASLSYFKLSPIEVGSKKLVLKGEDKIINISRCGQDYKLNSSEFENLYNSFDFSSYYCLDPGQIIKIENPFGFSYDFSFLNVFFTRCNNKHNCKNSSISDEMLSSFYIGLISTKYHADNQNFELPLKPYSFRFTELSSSTVFKRIYYDLKNVNYVSDNGLFLTDKVLYNRTTFDQARITMDLSNKDYNKAKLYLQLTFSFSPDGLHDDYYRYYLKVPSMLAYVGGVLNILKITCSICLYFFYEISFVSTMFSHYLIYFNDDSNSGEKNTSLKKIYPFSENLDNSEKLNLNYPKKNKIGLENFNKINYTNSRKEGDIVNASTPPKFNQSDIKNSDCISSIKNSDSKSKSNKFPATLKYIHTMRKNQNFKISPLKTSNQNGILKNKNENLMMCHYPEFEKFAKENNFRFQENRKSDISSNFASNKLKLKFSEIPNTTYIAFKLLFFCIKSRSKKSDKIYNLAKEKLITYYLNINSLIDMRNEINFFKKCFLIDNNMHDICSYAQKITSLNLKNDYKNQVINFDMKRDMEQRSESILDEAKEIMFGYLGS